VAGNVGTSAAVNITVNNVVSPPPPPPAPTPGDANGNGHVDITDLSILLSNYNTSNASCDFNNDGIVNITDLSILLSNYGK
jgi:hypothetical protein